MDDVDLIGDFILNHILDGFVEHSKIIRFSKEDNRLILHFETRSCGPSNTIFTKGTVGNEEQEDFDESHPGEHDEDQKGNDDEIDGEISHDLWIDCNVSCKTSNDRKETNQYRKPGGNNISWELASFIFQKDVGNCKQRHDRQKCDCVHSCQNGDITPGDENQRRRQQKESDDDEMVGSSQSVGFQQELWQNSIHRHSFTQSHNTYIAGKHCTHQYNHSIHGDPVEQPTIFVSCSFCHFCQNCI